MNPPPSPHDPAPQAPSWLRGQGDGEQPPAKRASVLLQQVEKHDMAWLAPLFKDGNAERVITVPETQRALSCGKTHVYKLISNGAVESFSVGDEYRIIKRSVMLHLWDTWSHRAKASMEKVTTFVLLLLPHLPISALSAIAAACQLNINSKRQSERSLGLTELNGTKPEPTGKHRPVTGDLFSQ